MKNFTFSKEITLGDLATIVVLIVWLARLEFRTNQNEAQIASLEAVQTTQTETMNRLSQSQSVLAAVVVERTGKGIPQ